MIILGLNAFHADMLRALGEAYTAYESNAELRCAVVFAHGMSAIHSR